MATKRRSSGFSTPSEEEANSVEEFLDSVSQEMFETISQTESESEAKIEEVEKPLPVAITPSEAREPKIVEESVAVPALSAEQPPRLQPKPRRHPRNTPKFSRHK